MSLRRRRRFVFHRNIIPLLMFSIMILRARPTKQPEHCPERHARSGRSLQRAQWIQPGGLHSLSSARHIARTHARCEETCPGRPTTLASPRDGADRDSGSLTQHKDARGNRGGLGIMKDIAKKAVLRNKEYGTLYERLINDRTRLLGET